MATEDLRTEESTYSEAFSKQKEQLFQDGNSVVLLQSPGFNDTFESKQPQWRSSLKPIDAGYGYEIPWKPSRATVSGAGLSHLGPNAAKTPTPEWRSSVRFIKPESGSRSDCSRSTIRYINPGHIGFKKWKPSVRVFERKESTESTKREGCRYVPPYSYSQPAWHPHKASVATRPQPEWVPPFRNINPGIKVTNSLRKRIALYFKEHPHIQLFSSEAGCVKTASEPLESATCSGDSGRKPLRKSVNEYFSRHPQLQLFSLDLHKPSNIRTGDLSPLRRYIPDGHLDHFESGTNCITKQDTLPVRSQCNMWSAAGNEFCTVAQRNVITGLLGQSDVKLPTKCAVVPTLFDPAGSFNKYVMDSRFSCQEAQVDKDCNRYSSDQQMEFLTSNSQAYENHRRRQTSVDPALTEHLYEVKESVCK